MSSTPATVPPSPPTLTRALGSGIDASNIGPVITRTVQELASVMSGSENIQQATIDTLNGLIASSPRMSALEKQLLQQVVTSFTPMLISVGNGTISTCEMTLFNAMSSFGKWITGLCKKTTPVPVPAPAALPNLLH